MILFKCVSILFACLGSAEDLADYEFHHDNVMGTQLELRVTCDDEATASNAEADALQEIDRLSAVLSTWNSKSEVSQWMRSGTPIIVSNDLAAVLHSSDRMRTLTHNAFHPGAELLTRMWKRAELSGSLPLPEEIRQASDQLKTAPWTWHPDGRVVAGDYPLSFDAIAKGYIIDQVCRRIMDDGQVSGVSINIGGDLRIAGRRNQSVAIRTEMSNNGSDEILDTIVLADLAMATSGPQFRGFDIGGQHFSHLLDPGTGMPVHHIRSSSVVAPTAEDADALATACSVLTVDKSISLIDSIPGAACLLLDDHGVIHTSSRWAALRKSPNAGDAYKLTSAGSDEKKSDDAKAKDKPVWNGGLELQVDLEINQADSGGRYRRPYVACWVEDKDGFPIRTLILWVQADGKGPRWIPDLRRWYKSDRLRKLADDSDLVDTISEATRKPGKYSAIWNGLDDNEDLVKPGKYTLYIEAAREHGTYQLIKEEITVADKTFEKQLKGNVEIKAATLRYRKVKAEEATGKSRTEK